MVKDLCNDSRTSINQQDSNGFTALIKASMRGNIECRQIIIDAGADRSIVDFDGLTEQERYNKYLKDNYSK